MKITIIAGVSRESALGDCVRRFGGLLSADGGNEIKEWYAPFGINGFCDRCMTCVREGEGKCRYSREFMPMWKSMTSADLTVFVTPVFVGGMPAALKNLFDHLLFAGLKHRPDARMFGARVLVLQAGESKNLASDIAAYTAMWGVSAVKTTVVSDPPTESELTTAVKKAEAMLSKKAGPSLSTRIAFANARKTVSLYGDCLDKKYWAEKGWLNGGTPWKDPDFRAEEKENA